MKYIKMVNIDLSLFFILASSIGSRVTPSKQGQRGLTPVNDKKSIHNHSSLKIKTTSALPVRQTQKSLHTCKPLSSFVNYVGCILQK